MGKPLKPTTKLKYDTSVFVNCPFDSEFLPLLHAIIFAIQDCGCLARHAAEKTGAAETRLEKIYRLILQSRLSIHDLSRVELDKGSKLPRFNMPFECGLGLGAIRYGELRNRDALVMAAERYQDNVSTSDLAGIDSSYHENSQKKIIGHIRRFLANQYPKVNMRGEADIYKRFTKFTSMLGSIASKYNKTLKEIESFSYINEWQSFATLWIFNNK